MQYKKEHITRDGRRLVSGGPRDLQQRQKQPIVVYGDIHGDQPGVVEELRVQIKDLIKALTNRPQVSSEEFDRELRISVEQAVKETEKRFEEKIKQLEDNKIAITSEQVNNEINKAILETTTTIEKKATKDIKVLENKLTSVINNKENELTKLNHKLDKVTLINNNEVDNLKEKITVLEDKIKDKDNVIKILEEKNNIPLDINDERIAELVAEKIAIDFEGGIYDPNRPQIEKIVIDPLEEGAGAGLEGNIEIKDVSPEEKENMIDKAKKLKNLLNKLPNAD